jgi:hypothetical protein
VVDVTAGYTEDSTTIPLDAGQPVTLRKKGAVFMPIFAPTAGYYPYQGFDKGIIYELERPQPPTTVTAVDGASQTIDVSFVRSIHEMDDAGTFNNRSGYGVGTHYWFFVLKHGDTYSTYAPEYLPARATESEYDSGGQQAAILVINDALVVDGATTATVSGLNRYFKPSDNSIAAIVAGDYYVGVMLANSGTRDVNFRGSSIAWSAKVTVA